MVKQIHLRFTNFYYFIPLKIYFFGTEITENFLNFNKFNNLRVNFLV
jgi:hypothetical protein